MVPQKVAQNDRSEHVLDVGRLLGAWISFGTVDASRAQNRVLGQTWSVETPLVLLHRLELHKQLLKTTGEHTFDGQVFW
jgi:hypothetical protein